MTKPVSLATDTQPLDPEGLGQECAKQLIADVPAGATTINDISEKDWNADHSGDRIECGSSNQKKS
jgi:hypothetical protein